MPRPHISINLAISADGKISSSPPRPSGWTSKADHSRLLELRANADAILVGRGTLDADRMTLTSPGKATQPLRCIVSRHAPQNREHPIFSQPGGEIHWLITGEDKPTVGSNPTLHHMSLLAFLEKLGSDFQVQHFHCEGGGELIRELAALDVIDEFHLTLAGHTLFGGQAAATATGLTAEFLPESRAFQLSHFEPRGDECFLSYLRKR
jgi:2,5-diamino-6-(ribosylamino)-4(3H)-pyrimidinone 5'-phosphate reductase